MLAELIQPFLKRLQELFGVLVPGAVGTAIGFVASRNSPLAQPFLELSQSGQWLAFGIAALVLGFIAYPLGWPLDKLYTVVYAKPRRRKGDPLLDHARTQAEKHSPGITGRGESIYDWAKNRVEAEDSKIGEERGFLQGISKMFRSLSLMFLGGCVFLWIQSQAQALWVIVLGIAFFLSFLLFCQLRWKATNLIYQRLKEVTDASRGGSQIIVP